MTTNVLKSLVDKYTPTVIAHHVVNGWPEEETAEQSDYLKYRGKCKEYCEQAIKDDPTLTMVRGHYWCPVWNTNEQHWWCVRQDGTIFDPTAKQFGSKGHGEYTPFDGICTCSECGRRFEETSLLARFDSNYAFCSTKCNLRFVGL